MRESARLVTQRREALLQVKRDRVVDGGAHVVRSQEVLDAVARRHPNHELVVDVVLPGAFYRQRHTPVEAGVAEQLAIACGIAAAGIGPRGQARRLHPKHCRLQRVDPEVPADQAMVILPLGAMGAQQPQPIGELVAAGGDEPCVAERAEVLAREEREATGQPERSGVPAADGAAERLRRVLDDRHGCGSRHLENRVHVGALPVEMHGHDRARARCDRRADSGRIEVVGLRVDVHQHRPGAAADDGAGGGEKRVSAGDDLVAGTDAERHQGHEQRVGAGGDADGVPHPDHRRQLALEPLDFGPENEPLAVADARDRGQRLVAELEPLRREVQQRHRDHRRGARAGAHSRATACCRRAARPRPRGRW